MSDEAAERDRFEGRARSETTRHDRWIAELLDFGNEHLSKSVEVNPRRRGGIPCIKGTRMTVGQILSELAESAGPDEVAKRYDLDTDAIVNLLYGLGALLERPANV